MDKTVLHKYWQFHCIHKTDDIYADTTKDVEARFDTSNLELKRPLSKRKTKKVVGVIKDRLGRKIMKKIVWFKAKTYSYLIDDDSEYKKAKGTKKCVLNLKIIETD